MFDKLEGLVDRLDTVLQELNDPDVAGNQNRFRDLMKEQNELTPIVEKYKEYKAEKQNIEDSLMLLEEESDEEMKELAKEELNESKANVERLAEELKILLIPKDPMDYRSPLLLPLRDMCLVEVVPRDLHRFHMLPQVLESLCI